MAPVEDAESVWLGSEGVSLSVLPAVATTSRRRAALAVNLVSPFQSIQQSTYFFPFCRQTDGMLDWLYDAHCTASGASILIATRSTCLCNWRRRLWLNLHSIAMWWSPIVNSIRAYIFKDECLKVLLCIVGENSLKLTPQFQKIQLFKYHSRIRTNQSVRSQMFGNAVVSRTNSKMPLFFSFLFCRWKSQAATGWCRWQVYLPLVWR